MSYATIICTEVWKHEKEGHAGVLCVRWETGCYSVYIAGERMSVKAPFNHAAFLNVLSIEGRMDREWIEARGWQSAESEFAIKKAAIKFCRRLLAGMTTAEESPLGWQPKPEWTREYDGDLTFQNYNANAKRDKLREEVEHLKHQSVKDDNQTAFSGSTDDYAARRRRQLELKRKQRELSEHGGSK